MWDARDRLDADLEYAVRMVQSRCASAEQAAAMCGVNIAALRERLSRRAPAKLAGTEKPSFALERHIPGAY